MSGRLLRAAAAAWLLARPAAAAPVFPPGYGQGFPVPEGLEWSGPSIEPLLQGGLKLKIARLDGEIKEGTVGSIRERFLRGLKDAAWPIPAEFRLDTLERFEETFFRKLQAKVQRVELQIFRQKEINYVVVKAYADLPLVGELDPAQIPCWRLPKGYGEGFPVFPLAQLHKVEVQTVEDKSLGIKPFQIGRLEGLVPGSTVAQVRDWYLRQLNDEQWPVPAFFNQDDDEKFSQPFRRRKDKVSMRVELLLDQRKPEEPVKLTLKAQQNEFTDIDDQMAKILEEKQASDKAANDPVKLIVDIDPDDPDIDFAELPRGFGAGLPIIPELQYIEGKIHDNEVIGQKWREAVIRGVVLGKTVPEVRDWYLKESEKAGYDVPSIHEEDEPNLFLTRLKRNTGNFSQSIRLKIFERAEDGLTQVDVNAQEDTDLGTQDPDNPETMMQMPQ
jgi:hypothetical protein